jgi:uncharacterized membrane protein (UPF0127 family)
LNRVHVRLAAACLLFAAVWAGLPATAAKPGPLPLSAFPREEIVVETRGARRYQYQAWRADRPDTRAQGLMFVEKMGEDQAMIFVYEPPQRVGMWMKNTLIPLDMLFVDERGCIVKVHERAVPGSTETISSGAPVVLVVELAGGTSTALGIAAGDRVLRLDAQWPRAPRPCTGER